VRAIAVGVVASVAVFVPASAGHGTKCSLRLTGLTVEKAKQRSARAGCSLRLRGARLTRPIIQTVARTQSNGSVVTAWLNPLCSTMGAPGPPSGEPKVTVGPTELVSGLYLVGGPHRFVSVRDCSKIAGTPGAGTITVRDPHKLSAPTNGAGALVATQIVPGGQLARIPLPPGTYTVQGTFGDAIQNGEHPVSRLVTVTIPARHTVRLDTVLSIP